MHALQGARRLPRRSAASPLGLSPVDWSRSRRVFTRLRAGCRRLSQDDERRRRARMAHQRQLDVRWVPRRRRLRRFVRRQLQRRDSGGLAGGHGRRHVPRGYRKRLDPGLRGRVDRRVRVRRPCQHRWHQRLPLRRHGHHGDHPRLGPRHAHPGGHHRRLLRSSVLRKLLLLAEAGNRLAHGSEHLCPSPRGLRLPNQRGRVMGDGLRAGHRVQRHQRLRPHPERHQRLEHHQLGGGQPGGLRGPLPGLLPVLQHHELQQRW